MKTLIAIVLACLAAHLIWVAPANAVVWTLRGFLTYFDLGLIATGSMFAALTLRDRRNGVTW